MQLFSWLNRPKKERILVSISKSEVLNHNTLEDCWVIIDNLVYDITEFTKYHPGNKNIFKEWAGKDVTQVFYKVHPYVNYKEFLKYEQVGYLVN
ncbi:cytochrome B5 [Tubulinosema ratisbonensis]|uniref:Cytochrome B5 n=1 Tax=Tubulinosema ratisbonensis TaxID=291195 RepID=A0A437AHE0_9MICR|nr:cytochrome B5 [Tubulinosema ratisbonensis]